MTNTTSENGRPIRKTLASQLDRLDGVIDSLSDGLNGAVLDALRAAMTEAVGQAVETVLREVLTRPEVLRQLAPQSSPAPTPAATPVQTTQPSGLKQFANWICAKVGATRTWLANRLQGLGRKIRHMPAAIATGAKEKAMNLWLRLRRLPEGLRQVGRGVRGLSQTAWNHKRRTMLATTIGLTVGAGSYFAGPVVAAVACGLCGVALTLGTQMVLPVWGLLQSLADSTT